MDAVDKSGLPPAEADAVRALLAGDRPLADELEMILPALSFTARRAFWRAFVDLGGLGERPAAVVLEALIVAARSRPE